MDELACDLAGEDVAVFVLAAAKEVKRVGAELQGAAKVRNESVLKGRFTCLPVDSEERKSEWDVDRERGWERKREGDREGGRKAYLFEKIVII